MLLSCGTTLRACAYARGMAALTRPRGIELWRGMAALLVVILTASFSYPAAAQSEAARALGSLRLIGTQSIPHAQAFEHTTVGGLSGIDYDPRTGQWLLISDDRSDHGPARWYTATLEYDGQRFAAATLTGMTPLRQADGAPYSSRLRGGRVPDAETVRIDPLDGSVWYASEGDRVLMLDPAVRQTAKDGRLLSEVPTSPMFQVRLFGNQGARNNLSYEGLTFAADGQSLWVAMEGPLVQDGGPPTPEAGALARFTQYDRGGRLLRQVAYPIEPIPARPGAGKYADNGVSEILAMDAARLLVLERSGVQAADGRFTNYVRLYLADLTQATDVASLASLADAEVKPATKRLVLDLNTLGLPRLDNFEGLAWGPKLANGNDTLVLVSDDNFNPAQQTLLLAFEVLP